MDTKPLLLFSLALLHLAHCKPNPDKELQSDDQKEADDQPVNGGYIFEGDMLMTKNQIKIAQRGGDVEAVAGGNAFAVQRGSYNQWPNGIVPYVIGDSAKNPFLNFFGIKGPTENAIRGAMAEWEKKTCVRFRPRTNEKDYVEFIDGGYGKCYSWVGRIGGRQAVSLGFECFYFGIALHEIGHALGLYHEQSRPDRDKYVYINWNNIESDAKSNFQRYGHGSIDSFGSPYDYDSIMHYEWNAFAHWPWQRTIGAHNGASIGQRSHLSTQDIIQIKKKYSCP